jgi:hypothetical protein
MKFFTAGNSSAAGSASPSAQPARSGSKRVAKRSFFIPSKA